MSATHCIRLRGPWEYRCGDLSGKFALPSDWLAALPAGWQGEVCFSRRFNRPTGLDEHAHVALVTSGLPETAVLSLNGSPPVTATGSDVSALLQPQNVVEVRFAPPVGASILGEVWLEIS